MLNEIILMGRLTRDPELRYTASNTPVASFSLAVDRDFKPKEGGERDRLHRLRRVARRGGIRLKYFQEDSMAAVKGRLQIRDWQGQEGNKRRSAEVVADNVYFGESKGGNRSNSSAPNEISPSGKPYPA